MEIKRGHRPLSPQRVAALLERHRGVVETAVGSARRCGRTDFATLLAEVESELALRMLSGKFDADDVTRVTFCAYLSRAARNIARDLLGRRRARTVVGADCDDVAPAAGWGASLGDGPQDALLRKERDAALRAALERLAAEQPPAAAILRARFFEGLSYPEIARRLGVEPKQVHLRAHRARTRLREMLETQSIGVRETMAVGA